MPSNCRVLLVAPGFRGQTFWSLQATCEMYGARFPAPPLGLITVAAMLPVSWECRLINRNTEELRDSDLQWADLVMTGGMLPQQTDTLRVIELAHQHGKPVAVGGPDVTSTPEVYHSADIRVVGEAETVIDGFVKAWEDGLRQGVFEAEKFTADVTRTPPPRFDLLKPGHYTHVGVQFARGCPFTCEFCDIIELYGRAPRVKTADQMLAELDIIYKYGYRGHVDFVDDNFIGNKKAVKAFLPHLIRWQKERGYPFRFSTEASINLADDDALLSLMRAANFFLVFVGIESPDTDTLVSMQKKQNTRRSIAESVHKIYRSGMLVTAGFIIGFDTEQDSVAEAMIDCVEATAIPCCIVGMLFALPNTQLTRRLLREGRLFPPDDTDRSAGADAAGDQCTSGLNFATLRPRRDILADYRRILARIYCPGAYYRRVRAVIRLLDLPVQERNPPTPPVPEFEFDEAPPIAEAAPVPVGPPPSAPRRRGVVPTRELSLLWRLVRRIAVLQPAALWPFCRTFCGCAWRNPRALESVGLLAALYLHVGPFSRVVMAEIDRQIADIDAGRWAPLQPLPKPPPKAALAEIVEAPSA